MHKPSRIIILLSAIFVCMAQESLAQQSSSTIQAEAQPLEQGKPIERELKTGEVQSYKVTLGTGQFLIAAVNQRGIDVVVRVFGPDGSRIAEIDSPNGTQGDEPIAVEAKATGAHRIEISSLERDAPPGRYEIRINELLSAEGYAARIAEINRKRQAVVAWLKENAIPIKTVEAGNGFADLQPLKKVFKDVRFVGLGEETHGTREFFQFKHRMLEFLVREMDFRVFALEASYSACQNINDYVMGKTDDGAKALDSQGFWTWNTEEVRAMIDWMRRHNQTVQPDKRVKFVGFDIQSNSPGQERLLEYLKRVAPERLTDFEESLKSDLGQLFADMLVPDRQKETVARLKELQIKYNELFVFLEINGVRLTAKSDQAELDQVREYARVIVENIDAYNRLDFRTLGGLRDLYMAENFRRIVEREPVGTRFVIWSHNGHLTVADGTHPPLGFYLRRLYGSDYYALGFSFDQGSFQARLFNPNAIQRTLTDLSTLTSFIANPAPADSIDWYLAQTNVKTFVVDFRLSRKNAEINEWLAATHQMRSIGAFYAANSEQNFYVPTILGREYDGLFFVDTTTRARPNPSVKNVAQRNRIWAVAERATQQSLAADGAIACSQVVFFLQRGCWSRAAAEGQRWVASFCHKIRVGRVHKIEKLIN